MTEYIFTHFSGHLDISNNPISEARLEQCAQVIHEKGAPLDNVWGFIDGTVRSICRPTRHQKVCYNGHKRVHALKYQSVTTPDGLIRDFFGPVEGRRHDSYLLAESNFVERARDVCVDTTGKKLSIYGDPAYANTSVIMSGYKGSVLTQDQQKFNQEMSRVRVTVEYGFQRVANVFAFVDFKKNQKVYLQSVGHIYCVAVFLVNMHSCYYGNQTASMFQFAPPSPQAYVQKN